MRTRLLIGLLGGALVLLALPAPAEAQTRFSWQLHGGGVMPMSAYVDNGVRIDEAAIADTGADQARLVDQFSAFGFHVGTTLTLLLRRLEIRYQFHRMLWATEVTACTSDPAGHAPIRQATNEIDDAAVTYLCGAAQQREADLSGVGLDPLLIHTLTGGYRFFIGEQLDLFDVFLVGAMGPAIATFNDSPADDSDLLGLHFDAGIGGEIFVSEVITVGIEGRYNLLLTRTPVRDQMAANRAVARDQSSFSALMDTFHYVTFSAGINLNFR